MNRALQKRYRRRGRGQAESYDRSHIPRGRPVPVAARGVRPGESRVGMACVAALLAVVLRLPSFCWSVISDDEAIYDAMAQGIRQGGDMYRDVLDHKPPGLVYVYAWVQAGWQALHPHLRPMSGVHAFGALAAALTCWGLYLVGRRTLPCGTQGWPPLLFALSSTAKCAYDGLAVNGELLMGLPSIFAVWALLEAGRHLGWRRVVGDFFAGALVGAAGLIKWQAMVVGLSFPLFGSLNLHALTRRVATRGPAWLAGLFLPLGLAAAHFYGRGILGAAWSWGVVYNLQYVAEGPSGLWALRRLVVQLLVVVAPAALFYGAGILGLWRSPLHDEAWRRAAPGLRTWALLSALSVCIGGRFFGHYFLQLELPLCLLGAPTVAGFWAKRRKATRLALAAPVVFFFVFSSSPQHVRRLLNGQDPDWQGCGEAIAALSEPDETLFVWGNAPLVYHYAQRTMGTRFSFCNYLTGLSPATRSEYDANVKPSAASTPVWLDLLDDLQRRKPTLVLDTATAGWKGYGKFPLVAYPQLAAYVNKNYRVETTIAGATLYRRLRALELSQTKRSSLPQ